MSGKKFAEYEPVVSPNYDDSTVPPSARSMQFAYTEPLTAANLGLLQLQTKDTDRVASFVREQWHRSSTLATDSHGFDDPQRKVMPAETPEENSTLPSTRIQGIGFSSPILKARMDKMQVVATASHGVVADESNNPGSDNDIAAGNNQNSIYKSRKRCPSTRCSSEDSNKLPVTKLRSSSKASGPRLNGDYATRLAERRDRKRVKRAIVNPIRASDITTDGKNLRESGKGGRKSERTRTKKGANISSELTLMHSFSATNIGKERLTLNTGSSMGVFNKGKASLLVRTSNGKRRCKKDYTFSESKFLKSVEPQIMQSHIDDSSSSSCTSNNSYTMRGPKISRFFTNGPCAKHNGKMHSKELGISPEKMPLVTEDVNVCSDIQSDLSEDRRRSEAWDIEHQKSLPSNDKSLSDQGQETQRTILNSYSNKMTLARIQPNCDVQPSGWGCSLPGNIESSPIREQFRVLNSPARPPPHSASQMRNSLQHEANIHQRQTNETINERLSVSHISPTFRFRPIKCTNHMTLLPPDISPFISTYDNRDDEGSVQARPDTLMANPDDAEDEPGFNGAWDMETDDPSYPEQKSRSSMLPIASPDDFIPDDDTDKCSLKDESSQELDLPNEHGPLHETIKNPIHEYELEARKTYLENVNEMLKRPYYLDANGWSGIPVVDAIHGDLGMDILTDQIVEDWGNSRVRLSSECLGAVDTEGWSGTSADNKDHEDLEMDALKDQRAEDLGELLFPRELSSSKSPIYLEDAHRCDSEPTSTAFTQGRSLLLGVEEPILHSDTNHGLGGIRSVEHEVATRLLKHHWFPQKP